MKNTKKTETCSTNTYTYTCIFAAVEQLSTRRNVHSKRTLQKTKRIQSGFNNCDYWFSLIPWFSFTPKVFFFTSVLEVKKTTLGFFHLQNGGELNHMVFFYLRFWSWKKPPRFFLPPRFGGEKDHFWSKKKPQLYKKWKYLNSKSMFRSFGPMDFSALFRWIRHFNVLFCWIRGFFSFDCWTQHFLQFVSLDQCFLRFV